MTCQRFFCRWLEWCHSKYTPSKCIFISKRKENVATVLEFQKDVIVRLWMLCDGRDSDAKPALSDVDSPAFFRRLLCDSTERWPILCNKERPKHADSQSVVIREMKFLTKQFKKYRIYIGGLWPGLGRVVFIAETQRCRWLCTDQLESLVPLREWKKVMGVSLSSDFRSDK